ncbi:hypothetical protein D3C78_20860 [compost metagenome]
MKPRAISVKRVDHRELAKFRRWLLRLDIDDSIKADLCSLDAEISNSIYVVYSGDMAVGLVECYYTSDTTLHIDHLIIFPNFNNGKYVLEHLIDKHKTKMVTMNKLDNTIRGLLFVQDPDLYVTDKNIYKHTIGLSEPPKEYIRIPIDPIKAMI